MEEITEQIGNVEDLPEWAQEAFNEGTLIKTCIARVEAAKKAMSTKSPLRKQCHEYILELGELGRQLADARELWKFQDESLNECYEKIDKLRSALEKYGNHTEDCARTYPGIKVNPNQSCTCGLEQALEGGE